MLDDFMDEQSIIYRILVNSVKKNKESHAYLIESNGYHKSLDLALAFSKYLLCPKGYSNSSLCKDCHQCENIDKNEFLELKIIDPDGQWIKKSQLQELQDMFSKKSILGNKKVYIINKAEKMNISTANSLLKFLEEPEEGIIAILIVENINQLLGTIVSRCQVLSLKKVNNLNNLSMLEKIANYLYDNNNKIKEYVSDDESRKKIEQIIEFIKYYETKETLTLLYINKLWNDYFDDRDELFDAFSIILLFYKDILKLKLNRNVEIFDYYVDELKKIANKNSISSIISKIKVIAELREKIKFNANINMLMDKLIIELKGCD